MTLNLNNLNKSIINCNKCSRLIQFRKKILKNDEVKIVESFLEKMKVKS